MSNCGALKESMRCIAAVSPGLFDGSDFKGLQEDRRAPFLQGFCPEAFVVSTLPPHL